MGLPVREYSLNDTAWQAATVDTSQILTMSEESSGGVKDIILFTYNDKERIKLIETDFFLQKLHLQ
jgi:hypothetical protein